MALVPRLNAALPMRALRAIESRGFEYAWHKFCGARLANSRRGNVDSYTEIPANIGHFAAAMIIFANRRDRKPAA